MAPLIMRDNREEEEVLILCDIMGGINPDESMPEAPECVELEGCLDAKNKCILVQV